MKMRNLFAVVAAAAFAASSAFAQCKAAGEQAAKGGPACMQDKTAAAHCTAGAAKCEGDKAKACMAGAPCIKYTVGDKSTCCPEEAAKLANGDKSQIKYSIGEQTFTNEADAHKALASALTAYLNDMTTVKFAVGKQAVSCPDAAAEMARKEGQPVRYRLAAYDFESKEAAEAAAKAAKEAAEGVKMSWKVGEKSFCCSAMAGDAAKKEGKSVEYCVGDKASACEATASIELATAKISAAAQAIEKALHG